MEAVKEPKEIPEEFRDGIRPEFGLTEKQAMAVTLVCGLDRHRAMTYVQAAGEMGATPEKVRRYVAAARDKAQDALCGLTVGKANRNPYLVGDEDARKMLELYRGGMSKADLMRRYGVKLTALSSALARAEAEELGRTS